VGTRPRLRALALLAALAVVVTACASIDSSATQPSGGDNDDAHAGPPQHGGKVVYGLEAETTNGWCLPEGQLAIAGIQVARSIYDTLTVPTGDGTFAPFLAKSVTPNADYTRWTITLRPGIRFHDGSPLTAQVVKNNLDAYRGQYPGRSSLLLAFVFSDVATTEATGPLTVVVTTKRPWSSFPSFLYSSGRVGIMAQAQLDDAKGCAKHLIGTGPFKLKEWRVNDHLTVVRNPTYWRHDRDGARLPYLDSIEFRPMPESQQRVNALKAGDIDAFHIDSNTGALTLDDMRAQDAAQQVNLAESGRFPEVGLLMLNTTKPPFDNPIAREAVALAGQRKLASAILDKGINQQADGPFGPGTIGYLKDTGYRTDDPARARALVKEYERQTGKQLAFQITADPTPELIQQVELSKQFFEDVGMKVSVTTLEQSALIQKAIEKGYQAITFRNYPGLDPDDNYVWWYDAKSNPVNFMGFSDPKVNTLLDQGRQTADPAARNRIYQDLNRELAAQHYMIWTSWTIWAVPMNPKVHNVVGARAPDGGSDYPGLALGHDMALLWKEK